MRYSRFENPNILQADQGFFHSTGVGPALSVRCPHCSQVGTFPPATSDLSYGKALKDTSKSKSVAFSAVLRVCPNKKCQGVIFTISNGTQYVTLPPELIDFDPVGLPERLLETLREAVACHAAGAYRASAMMVRRLLEELCEESSAEGHDLHARLSSLRTKIILPEELFEAMLELKALGNDAAHIVAKNYANIGKAECEDSIELAKEILKARFQLKGLVERLRSRKKSDNLNDGSG